MGRTSGRARRARIAGVLLASALVLVGCSTDEEPAPTARVDRGPVTSSVSASGSLVAISELQMGFADGGQLQEVLVRVGDRVAPGQVLARLDDFAVRQTLAQREAQLAQQQAMLDKVEGGNSVEAAQATLDQAQAILDATEDQVDATNAANAQAVDDAEAQLAFDQEAAERARARLRADRAACAASPTSTRTSTQTQMRQDDSYSYAPLPFGSGHRPPPTQTPVPTPTPDPACERIPTDETAVTNAERQVVLSETALNQAESQVDTDSASGQVSIENAEQSVVAAQNDLDAALNDRPADIDEREAGVTEAAAAVAAARRDVEEAVLIAPTAGVVSVINGVVGEYVGAASGTTPLAPGTTARLPDTSDDAPVNPEGAGTFLVLDDVDTFQMVVSFEETDATRIAPNQRVEVTVDAVSGLTLPGMVLAVAPAGTNSDGVIEFAVTVVLETGDPQLRDGQTAEASVLVDAVENVLRVPNAAVGREMGRTVVRIPGEDGEPVVVPFEAGIVGDDFTEARSGLLEGQIVLLPQGRVVASPPQGGPPPRR